ncbi:MAG TPA: hypothetical protein VN132_02915 [Bdellovibrio sp.]|nr:hypothetical protein [Bdellovibrio sp.]
MKRSIITLSLLVMSALAQASDKDFPPGCLTGADNSRTALVALDNYTALRGSNTNIEQLKKSLKDGQTVFIDGQLLTSLGMSDADAKSVLEQIKSSDNSN